METCSADRYGDMTFEFATATRILFGFGVLATAKDQVLALGTRALVVHGNRPDRADRLRACLGPASTAWPGFAVGGEPTVDLVREGIRRLRESSCDLVMAIGGGSVLDAGKAIAVLATNPGDPLEYLEVIGGGRPLDRPSVPFVAIPTTAGTGSEVTRNAVLGSPEHRVKVSLRAACMLPALAIVDPELTLGLPPALTASTGMDALTQLMEPFVSSRANPITDSLCREGLVRVARSLRVAFATPGDRQAREDTALASLLGGLALTNAGLGVVHAFAAPLGGMFPVAHGAVCGALLPGATEVNLAALRARAPSSVALDRYREIAALLTGRPLADADAAVIWIRQLAADLGIENLRRQGVNGAESAEVVAKAARANSLKSNPISLTTPELHDVLARGLS